jgi:hypothetical protein
MRSRGRPWLFSPVITCRGQHTIEYALTISVIIGGLFLVSTYVRRALQARYAAVVDAAATSTKGPRQYEPYYPSSAAVVTRDGEVKVQYHPGGSVVTTVPAAMPQMTVVDPGAWEKTGVSLKDDDDWR